MKLSKTARQRGVVQLLLLFAVIALIIFVVISQSAEFKNKLFSTLFPNKPSSSASEPISGPVGTGGSLAFSPNKTTLKVGEEVSVQVLVKSEGVSSNLFKAKIDFNKEYLNVARITYSDVISNWVEQYADNNSGVISLVGGVPGPGFETTGSSALQVATVYFKAIKVGRVTISFTNESAIYRNFDNINILQTAPSISLTIEAAASDLRCRVDSDCRRGERCIISSGACVGASSPTPSPRVTPTPISVTTTRSGSGDGNGDGRVDLTDLSILLTDYGKTSGARSSINMNGDKDSRGNDIINAFDFSLLRNLLVQRRIIRG